MFKRRFTKNSKVEQVGDIRIPIPEPPGKSAIAGFDYKRANQKFRRTEFPPEMASPRLAKKLPPAEVERIIELEYNRRIEGYWFYNCGEPTYITGLHYMYLNYWSFGDTYPDFRTSDREFFLFLDYCMRDPKCRGMIYIKPRREGASTRAGLWLYDIASRVKKAKCAVQSKTENDSEEIFEEMILKPWRQLIKRGWWFRPISEDVDLKGSGKGLVFSEPKKNISRKQMLEMQEMGESVDLGFISSALESKIVTGPSNEEHFDGAKLQAHWSDEVGKTVRSNVDKRHDILKECVVLGAKVIGKLLLTSTVEEMTKKGGANCRKVWDKSDFNNRNEYGETTSGLYRLFKPADNCLEGFIDEYGRPDRIGARKYIIAKYRDARRDGGPDDEARERRKYPLTISDAFLDDPSETDFDVTKIVDRLDEISPTEGTPECPYIRGNLEWVPGKEFQEVRWHPNVKGKWWLKRGYMLEKEIRNNISIRTSERRQLDTKEDDIERKRFRIKPNNKYLLLAGVDPFDFSVTADGSKKSSGAIAVRGRTNEWSRYSDKYIMIYKERPPKNHIFYEDVAKTLIFCGCAANIEKNRHNCIRQLEEWGMTSFIYLPSLNKKKRQSNEEVGEYTTTTTHISFTDLLRDHIYEHIDEMDFPPWLEEAKSFKVKKVKEFDLMVASGLAEIANAYLPRVKRPKDRERIKKAMRNVIQRYMIVDGKSVPYNRSQN